MFPATVAFGTIGAAGAVAYHRRNSMNNSVDANGQPVDKSPIAVARRRSTVLPDTSYDSRKQAEYQWRRDYGINLSHNSKKHFPSDIAGSPK